LPRWPQKIDCRAPGKEKKKQNKKRKKKQKKKRGGEKALGKRGKVTGSFAGKKKTVPPQTGRNSCSLGEGPSAPRKENGRESERKRKGMTHGRCPSPKRGRKVRSRLRVEHQIALTQTEKEISGGGSSVRGFLEGTLASWVPLEP